MPNNQIDAAEFLRDILSLRSEVVSEIEENVERKFDTYINQYVEKRLEDHLSKTALTIVKRELRSDEIKRVIKKKIEYDIKEYLKQNKIKSILDGDTKKFIQQKVRDEVYKATKGTRLISYPSTLRNVGEQLSYIGSGLLVFAYLVYLLTILVSSETKLAIFYHKDDNLIIFSGLIILISGLLALSIDIIVRTFSSSNSKD